MSICLNGQQVADTAFNPPIPNPMYTGGEGPVVFVDEGHNNFHTRTGRYLPFAKLLERDGYTVRSYTGEFTREKLADGKILVISNALNEINVENWYVPTPSAFTSGEIEIIRNWVHDGGSLFLIADHMPMGGAAQDLAAVFGFEFTNGFVFDTVNRGTSLFTLDDQSLVSSRVTEGRGPDEAVDLVATFTGQGFQIPEDATPVLTFDDRYVNLLPDTAWVFNVSTKRMSAGGWCQGAYKLYGYGRVVAFGEAAMFSAQLGGPQRSKMGMNSDSAPQNYQLLLNIMHWLDGKL